MVRKALIPLAGLGTRMRPLTAAVPKAMFPLADSRGRVLPVVHLVCAEAVGAGVEQVGLIVSPEQQDTLERYFAAARDADADVDDLPGRIEYVVQDRPRGFGDAVACAADFVGADEPAFLLLLGDHVHVAPAGVPPCAAQVLAAFSEYGGAAMVGVQTVGPDKLALVGAARGEALSGNVYRCTDFIEKPGSKLAAERLVTPGLGPDEFLAHCGIYVFTREIFDCLAELAAGEKGGQGELELSDAQSMLLRRHADDYYLLRIEGRACDTGTPAGYIEALEAVRKG